MGARSIRVLAVAVAFVAAGCATGEEMSIWRSQSSHFASGEHLMFSVRNQAPAKGKAMVTRQDIAMARAEQWWGMPVTVDQSEILER